MQCQNHPEYGATGTCTGCAEEFCASCLVMVRGGTYCAGCKTMAVAGLAPQSVAICKDAKSALGVAFVGVFFNGLFCGLGGLAIGAVALSKASAASTQIHANPALGGRGWIAAARVVGVAVMVLGVVSMLSAMRGKLFQ